MAHLLFDVIHQPAAGSSQASKGDNFREVQPTDNLSSVRQ
jgi:hypothetical protein